VLHHPLQRCQCVGGDCVCRHAAARHPHAHTGARGGDHVRRLDC
jgi:hypothetical protein